MDARQRRATDAARKQLAIDRTLAAKARADLAAGKIHAADDLLRALTALHAAGELNGDLEVVAVALAELVMARLLDVLGITETDPRVLHGKLLSLSDDPYAIGAVLYDTDHALLVDHLTVATVDETLAPLVAMYLDGRVNKTTDRHSLLLLGDVDMVAAFIVELYALAARGGFTAALDAAVDQRTAALPAPPDPAAEGTTP